MDEESTMDELDDLRRRVYYLEDDVKELKELIKQLQDRHGAEKALHA